MPDELRWVLLAYRLPREPSTPRIALWRKLRQLGAVQVLDGLVALPRTNETREQLDWLANSVLEAGGEASVWLAEPAAGSQTRALRTAVIAARTEEYRAVIAAATAARAGPAPQRILQRLRRQLRRIRARDYFAAPERNQAEAAVEGLQPAKEATP